MWHNAKSGNTGWTSTCATFRTTGTRMPAPPAGSLGGRIDPMAQQDRIAFARTGSTDLQRALAEDIGGVPFRTELSLKPVIDFWTRMEGKDSAKGVVARVITDEVEMEPVLLVPLSVTGTVIG